ncbi:kinetochore-associated protein DSN1 homolog isoform X1 [Centroberyx affinis]|uniref:kinetochore-associated protein DSN1 homolog isoform X1 n=1 Tax=Centroberyx affinis TaxID=166261 RepID=UPI003A5C72EE
MADIQLKTAQDSRACDAVADTQDEVNSLKQSHKRASTSPSRATPSKSPRTGSPPSTTPMPDAGEGGMETGREEMQAETSEGLVPTEGPSVSCNTRRKSWRRATIGRRSLPALPNPYQILCRSISTSLSQQERLEKLMEASMRLAVERTQNSLQSTPNASLESFQKQVEHMQKEWCCLAKSIRSEPQCQQLSAATASDPAVQKSMEQTQKAIHRLQAESDSWEALLNKHRSKAKELAKKVEQGQESGVTLDPSSLARSSQHQLIQSKPDYRSLLCKQQPILHTMEMVMDTQCKMVRELLTIQEHSQLLVKETSGRLAAEEGFQDLSPDIIGNLVALPLSSATS